MLNTLMEYYGTLLVHTEYNAHLITAKEYYGKSKIHLLKTDHMICNYVIITPGYVIITVGCHHNEWLCHHRCLLRLPHVMLM